MGKIRKGWHTGYFTAPDAIFNVETIGGYSKSIYLYLCRCADSELRAYPGYSDISKKTGFSVSTVRRAIEELEKAGLLIKENRYNPETGRYYANEYTLIHPDDAIDQDLQNEEQGYVLPEQGYVLPEQGYVLPEQGVWSDRTLKDYTEKQTQLNKHNKGQQQRPKDIGLESGTEEIKKEIEKRITVVVDEIEISKWLKKHGKDYILTKLEIVESIGRFEKGPLAALRSAIKGNWQPAKKGVETQQPVQSSKYDAFYKLIGR